MVRNTLMNESEKSSSKSGKYPHRAQSWQEQIFLSMNSNTAILLWIYYIVIKLNTTYHFAQK